ncbi:CDP-diacylglycerol--glycerol-3-phosphate 3-phosphatidyltransferase [Candidatus Woesearchaeota archaeon]|nr:CDP-diacylglycerol--glycerol-3-phosphate 3-phosphatidyltransferase [Candidatus Woesearchaeota archaeon]
MAKDIFSKPNQITVIRVLLIPLFVYFLVLNLPYIEYFAAFIFIILSLSDALDGYIARKRKEITEIGKLIDPIADKLLISVALIFFMGKGIPLWMVVVIIAREWIITGLRLIFVSKGTVVSASILGKLKTITQTIGILLVILKFQFAWHVMLIAVLFTVISGLDYLIKFSNLVKDKMLNIPNLITLTRLVLIPVFVIFVFEDKTNISIMIFAIIALSDKIDGISARLMKQVTEFGSNFDSFTDWTFIVVALIAFIYSGHISFIFGILAAIPSVSTAIIKLYYLKKHNKTLTSTVSKITVGLSYITVLTILINFVYKNHFLIAALSFAYLTMVAFMAKASSRKL